MMKKLVKLAFFLACLLVSSPVWAQYTSQLSISGQSNVTIDGATFTTESGHCIHIIDSTNIAITNSTFSTCSLDGIFITGASSNITITGNSIEDARSGVVAAPSSGTGYVFSNNRCKNIRGPISRGQCVQFNGVNGTGNRVENNYSIAFHGSGRNPEDHISIYNSGGTVADPLIVRGNYIEGGGPTTKLMTSGCGIVVGDNGGSYIQVTQNVLVNPGQCGLGVAGGSFITVDSNTIYSRRTPFSNVGLVAYASTAACDNITVTNNRVYWWSRAGYLDNTFMPTSGGNECTNRTYSNNTSDSTLVRRSTAEARTP